MSDNEFIDKLNDIIVNYGYILIDMSNYEYYFKRYNIYKYIMKYFEDMYHHPFILFDIKNDMMILELHSIYLMLNGDDKHFSIFKWIEVDMNCDIRWFSNEFSNFMMSIKGTSKEEILLKLQMMG